MIHFNIFRKLLMIKDNAVINMLTSYNNLIFEHISSSIFL